MSDDVAENDTVAAEEAVTEVVDERSDIERERDEYLAALQRLQADFENYRKRVARSSVDAADRAAGEVVVKMLPVLDAFDLAAAHFLSAPSEEAEALDQARGLLLDALSKQGLERIDDVGVEFNPQVHDAVAHADGEGGLGGETMVEEVLRSGYRWKGQVLRPAMVRVRG